MGMRDLLIRNHLEVKAKILACLTDDQWNDLGDWLYYRCNPNERDSIKNRKVPELIAKQGYT